MKIGAYLLYVALVILAYYGSLNNEFTYDDHGLVLQDARILNGDWQGILTQSYWGDNGDGLYRPITSGSLALNWIVCQDRSWGYHLVNLVLHICVGAMLLHVGKIIGGDVCGLIAAIVYGLFPGHSEAVFSIVGRAELLASFWGMAAIICYFRKEENSRLGVVWIIGAFIFLLFSMFSKENGTVFALSIVFWGICFRQRLGVTECLAVIAVVVYLASKWLAIGTFQPASIGFLDNPLAYESMALRVGHGFGLIVRAVLKLIYPWPLVADYSPQQIFLVEKILDPAMLLPVLFVATIVGAGTILVIRNSEYAIWAAISAGGILLISNVFVVTGTIFAERLLYIPALGVAITWGWALSRLEKRHLVYIAACWIAVAGGILRTRGAEWRSDLTLFSSAVRDHPKSARSHFGLGLALHRGGNLEKASQEYEKALGIYPRYFEARLNHGSTLIELGRYEEAINAYRKVIEQRPKHFQGRYALSLLELQTGNRAWAEKTLRQLHSEWPNKTEIIRDLAGLLFQQGDTVEAAGFVEVGLAVDPTNEGLLHIKRDIEKSLDH